MTEQVVKHVDQIPDGFYNKWFEIIKQKSVEAPNVKEFNLPTSKEDQMLSMMYQCWIEETTVFTMLKERKAKFDLAVEEYKKSQAQE